MSKFARIVLAGVALLGAAPAVWSAADLKTVLQGRYAEMKKAMAAHDGKAIAALLAPDFVSIDVRGQSKTGDQMIAEVNALKPDPNKTSETTLTSVMQANDTATVEQRYDMKTLRAGTDGVQHPVEIVALSTDTWVNAGGAWLMRRTVTNEVSLYRDGQLAAHQQKP